MTETTPAARPPRRRTLRLLGTVLWCAVGAALFGVWWQRAANQTVAQTKSDEAAAAQVINVEPDADGKIDLGKVLRGETAAEPNAKTPTYDPNGVEDFSFENCDGRTITKQDLLGKPWVAGFVFTHCLTTCPMITKRMRDLQDRLKKEDVQFVTLTVDPKRDTREVLKKYAELNGADLSRWYFLRGEAIQVYGLIHRSFQMPVQMPDAIDGNYQVIHSNNVMLVGPDGVVRGKYLGTNDDEMATLAREIRRMKRPRGAASTSAAGEIPADAWYMQLPAVNAGLNALSTVLLALGFALIKSKRVIAHRNVMLTAFAVSIIFLACYLIYHAALHHDTGLPGKRFEGTGPIRTVYFTILISHVLLAMLVPVLAIITIYRGLKADWTRHRKIAKITFPIWMYVSVTGVIIYLMLYHWPIAA